MKQIDLREGARRQHRAVALFAVLQCWMRGLDGLGFARTDLERLLGLERFKQTRVDWMKEDFKDLFPHQWSNKFHGQPRSFASMILSRVEFREHVPGGVMSLKERIEGISKHGPRLGLFQMWDVPSKQVARKVEGFMPFMGDPGNFDERLLSSYLSLLAQGQVSPKSLPPLKEKATWRISLKAR